MSYNLKNVYEDLPLVKKGTTFSCLRCGRCCKFEVVVSELELKIIEEKYPEKVKEVERIRKCKQISYGLYSLLFSTGKHSECIFLKNNLCTIHDYKPALCKLYPFFPLPLNVLSSFCTLNLKDLVVVESKKKGKRYVVSYDENCPGIGKGSSEPDWSYLVDL
ncbi:MAG: YkgJ family cysteine cluster protein [Thermoproteota archaeon]